MWRTRVCASGLGKEGIEKERRCPYRVRSCNFTPEDMHRCAALPELTIWIKGSQLMLVFLQRAVQQLHDGGHAPARGLLRGVAVPTGGA